MFLVSWCKSCLHNWPTLSGEKQGNNNWRLFFNQRLLEIRVCKKVLLKEEILPHYQNPWFFLNFWHFKNLLIVTKCLLPCMFEKMDVYYINLILVILPLCCFSLKVILSPSKILILFASLIKMMKNAFYFILKAPFVLKII